MHIKFYTLNLNHMKQVKGLITMDRSQINVLNVPLSIEHNIRAFERNFAISPHNFDPNETSSNCLANYRASIAL